MDENQIEEFAAKAEKMLEDSTKRKAVAFKILDEEPDIFTSKIGGTPYIPYEAAVPSDSTGREMRLLAQIDCTLLDGLKDYPHEGMLQFYMSAKDPWAEQKIVYHKSIDKTVTQSEVMSKLTDMTEEEKNIFPVINGGYGIQTQLVEESMNRDDERCGTLLCNYFAQLVGEEEFFEVADELSDYFDPNMSDYWHKLGGYKCDPQSWTRYRYKPGMKLDLESDEEELLLFQLSYEHKLGKGWQETAKVIIGDAGVLNFTIKRKDLKSLDLDKAIFNVSSS